MVPDPSTGSIEQGLPDPAGSNTLVNGLLGGIVGVVLSFVPFSPVLAGAIAAYLEGGTSGDGFKVGAIAGVVMAIPTALFGAFFAMFLLGLGGSVTGFVLLFTTVFLLGGLYTIGLAVLGGWLGIYAKNEL